MKPLTSSRKLSRGWSLEADFNAVYGTRWELGETGHSTIESRGGAASALINVWITAALSGELSCGAGITEAEEWFYGGDKDLSPLSRAA